MACCTCGMSGPSATRSSCAARLWTCPRHVPDMFAARASGAPRAECVSAWADAVQRQLDGEQHGGDPRGGADDEGHRSEHHRLAELRGRPASAAKQRRGRGPAGGQLCVDHHRGLRQRRQPRHQPRGDAPDGRHVRTAPASLLHPSASLHSPRSTARRPPPRQLPPRRSPPRRGGPRHA